jgi:type II secretory pathway component PulK
MSVRRGVALLVVVVALALVGVAMGITAWQITAGHRLLDRREHELQALWLARSGVEIAAARLSTDSANYTGEVVELIPHSEVNIRVTPDGSSTSTFRVTSEARYSENASHPVARSVECQVRRVTDGNKITMILTNTK